MSQISFLFYPQEKHGCFAMPVFPICMSLLRCFQWIQSFLTAYLPESLGDFNGQ